MAPSNDNCGKADPVLRRLHIAAMLCTFFLVVEVIGGYISGSLAILSDAAHLMADLTAFAVAIIASHLANLPSSEQHTFGLKRAESLAALLSMISLAIVSVGLAFEAVRRLFWKPEDDVDGSMMSVVAFIGVLVNVALAVVLGEHHVHLPGHSHNHSHDHHEHSHHHREEEKGLDINDHSHTHHDHAADDHDHAHNHCQTEEASHDHSHHHSSCDNSHSTEKTPLVHHHAHEIEPTAGCQHTRNVNLHAAYLHVMGDLAQSAAVLLAGLVIYFKPTWTIVDPLATLFFCTLVFCSTLPVMRRSICVLLEEIPPHISFQSVYNDISGIPNVSGVHDLHIWSISDGKPGLSVHCFVTGNANEALMAIEKVCHAAGIAHSTIQIQVLGLEDPTDVNECITCHRHQASDCVQTNSC